MSPPTPPAPPGPSGSDPLLSVIVTFFRLGGLAEPCLRSLRHQSDPRINLILVDDGSGDGTAERLREVAARLPAAEVLALPTNVGVAAARMQALSMLDTEWVTFVDGDDWLAPGYLPALLEETLRARVPWIRTDHVACTGRQRELVRIPDPNRAGRIGVPRDSIMATKTSSVDFAHSWSGVYHRELVDEGILHFPTELASAEDRPTIWNLHLQVPTFTIAETVGVHYRLGRDTSLTRTNDVRQLAIVESMRQVGELVAADVEGDRFLPKVLKTWTGLFAWHWDHRARLAPGLRARFAREAGALLDSADQRLLGEAIVSMPESRRQLIESLRRTAAVVGPLGAITDRIGGAR